MVQLRRHWQTCINGAAKSTREKKFVEKFQIKLRDRGNMQSEEIHSSQHYKLWNTLAINQEEHFGMNVHVQQYLNPIWCLQITLSMSTAKILPLNSHATQYTIFNSLEGTSSTYILKSLIEEAHVLSLNESPPLAWHFQCHLLC